MSVKVVCYPQCCSTYIHGQSNERGNGELEGRSTDADHLCKGLLFTDDVAITAEKEEAIKLIV